MYIHFNAMRSMGKKAVSLILMLTLGLTNAWGETETKTEGFEIASTGSYGRTVYKNTYQSDCEIGWKIFYGNVSTTKAITDSKSCLMQYYKASSTNRGYAQTTTPLKGLTNVAFKALVTDVNIQMYVWYSTDTIKWYTLATGEEFFLNLLHRQLIISSK